MKVLVKGIVNSLVKKPSFVGWKGTCDRCGAVVEIEEGDRILSTDSMDNTKWATVYCPTEGCFMQNGLSEYKSFIHTLPPKE